jgi:hypothetical protein
MNNETMSINEIKDHISDINENALILDGLDEAIVGIAHRNSMDSVFAYDKNKIIDTYMKDGMTHEEAEEFFWTNTHGAWMGDGTPLFVEIMRDANESRRIKVLVQ